MWRYCSFGVLLVGAARAVFDQHTTTPVQKVVELLVKLRDKVQEEGRAEAALYDKFACFCREQTSSKQYEIGKSNATIDELSAAVTALEGDIAQLNGDVAARKADVATEKGLAEAALAARGAAHADYLKKRANLTDAIEVITSAMDALRTAKGGVEGTKAASLLSRAQKAVGKLPLTWPAFAGLEAAKGRGMQLPAGGGAPPTYEYRSADVIATLQSLLRTFKAKLVEVDEEEALASHDTNMLEGARANKVMAYQKEIDQKEKISAEKSEQKSEKEGFLADETAARDADQAFLDDLTASCEAKAQLWDGRSKARADEITAISEAVGILQGMGDVYGANRRLVGLLSAPAAAGGRGAQVRQHRPGGLATRIVQRKAGANRPAPALLQLAGQRREAPRLAAALALLKRRGQALRSSALAALAARNASDGSDHFAEVRSIVKDLIARLEAEAIDEATQKTLCDGSVQGAVEKRDRYAAEMESLAARVNATRSEIYTLSSEIEELGKEIATLHQELNTMTELRSEGKALNEKTVVDANAGAEAVRQAISVLTNFYQGFLQLDYVPPGADRYGNTVADMAPETFSGEYSGKASESKGIIALLEVIAADFERTSSATASEEERQEGEFQTQSGLLNGQIEAKQQEKSTKEGDITTKESDLTGLEDDLKRQTQLHSGAIEELEALHAGCVDSGESWEERRQHRQQEIEALKEALRILEDWQG